MLELEPRDIALHFGHRDGGELVRELYGMPTLRSPASGSAQRSATRRPRPFRYAGRREWVTFVGSTDGNFRRDVVARRGEVVDASHVASEVDPVQESIVLASFENRSAAEHTVSSLASGFRKKARKGQVSAFVVTRRRSVVLLRVGDTIREANAEPMEEETRLERWFDRPLRVPRRHAVVPRSLRRSRP